MGRKIIGCKHRGIRDPEKQQAARLAAISHMINCPPREIDAQAIPKSLLRIQELQRRMLNSRNAIKDRNGKCKKNDHKIGLFKRLKGETDKTFLNRVHKQTEEVVKEAQFSDKYNVEIIRNKQSGEVERVQKRCKDKLEEYLKKVRKDKSGKKKSKKQLQKESELKLTKSQKKRQKLLAKKLKHLENSAQPYFMNKQKLMNEVAFGEVCHAPPILTLPRLPKNNNKPHNTAEKPEKRNLLLESILKSNNDASGIHELDKSVDRKERLKKLPSELRKKIESNQKAAIEAYKQLKANKYKQ